MSEIGSSRTNAEMKAFQSHTGIAAALDRANVDTDQIIPKQFLKRIERTGYGEFLFYDWRYDSDGEPLPDFVLNQEKYRETSILITGRNFGCGSSREHAAWAILDYGIRAIIASSFADIFATNCIKNGIVPVVLEPAAVEELLRRVRAIPDYRLTVALDTCTVFDDLNFAETFAISEFKKRCLWEGLDDIALTLRHEPEIVGWESQRATNRLFPTTSVLIQDRN
jgi:3-isopropylmalate/(R)-2-methylmalate dehydratase small subunit